MTSDRFNPPRLGEDGPEALRALVRDRRDGPSRDSVNKMSERLAAAGVMHASADAQAAASEKKVAYYKLGGLLLVVTGGFLLASQTWQTTEAPAAPAKAVAPVVAPLPNTGSERPPEANRVEPSKVQAVATISVNELPVAVPKASPSSTTPTAAVPTPTANTLGTKPPAVSELQMVQRAQTMLTSDPGGALGIAGEHARAFPNGEFVQEREVIAVEALSRLGQKEDAMLRARSLLQRFPRTPYAARLEMAVGQPLSKTTPNDPANSPAPGR